MTFYVYGGERPDPSVYTFRDPATIEFTGAFSSRQDAYDAWKARAWMTVDNALMRFEIHTYDEIVAAHGRAIADRAVAASCKTYA